MAAALARWGRRKRRRRRRRRRDRDSPVARSAVLGSSRSLPRSGSSCSGDSGARQLRTFEADERSTTSGCGGRARYKEGKHGGGGLRRRRRRGKRLGWDHGAEAEQGSDRRPKFLAAGREVLRRCAPRLGRQGSSRAWHSAEEPEVRKGGDWWTRPRGGPCVRQRGSGAASSGSEAEGPSARGRAPAFSGPPSRATRRGPALRRQDDRHPASGEGLHPQRGPAVGRPGHRTCVVRLRGAPEGYVSACQGREWRWVNFGFPGVPGPPPGSLDPLGRSLGGRRGRLGAAAAVSGQSGPGTTALPETAWRVFRFWAPGRTCGRERTGRVGGAAWSVARSGTWAREPERAVPCAPEWPWERYWLNRFPVLVHPSVEQAWNFSELRELSVSLFGTGIFYCTPPPPPKHVTPASFQLVAVGSAGSWIWQLCARQRKIFLCVRR